MRARPFLNTSARKNCLGSRHARENYRVDRYHCRREGSNPGRGIVEYLFPLHLVRPLVRSLTGLLAESFQEFLARLRLGDFERRTHDPVDYAPRQSACKRTIFAQYFVHRATVEVTTTKIEKMSVVIAVRR